MYKLCNNVIIVFQISDTMDIDDIISEEYVESDEDTRRPLSRKKPNKPPVTHPIEKYRLSIKSVQNNKIEGILMKFKIQ